jgi:NADH:ubiquinone oxidoreductase subunit
MNRLPSFLTFLFSPLPSPSFSQVLAVIRNVQHALKTRGGWKGLFDHMYTNGDYPFKVGRLVGTDPGGNKYYENTKDFAFGQHRWVEYADHHNYDPSSIPPDWHSWMHSMSDEPGQETDAFLKRKEADIKQILKSSDAPYSHQVGQTNEPPPNPINHLHNMSQIRSRGFQVGNTVFYTPSPKPGETEPYYTQPGSQYAGKQKEYVDKKLREKGLR